MKRDGAIFESVILGLLLIIIECSNIYGFSTRVKENQPYDHGQDFKDYPYIREKRSGNILMVIGRKALRRLLIDSVKKQTDKKLVSKFEKQGSVERAESDFSAVNPTIIRKGTYTNGEEYEVGEVGDRIMKLTKNRANGEAVIEVMRKPIYRGRTNYKTEIVYKG